MKLVRFWEFTRKNSFAILFITALFIFFHHLNEPGFFLDGLIYAGLGKNAAVKGHWLIPYLSDTYYPAFYDHIPFMIILEGLFFKLTCVSFSTARIFINLFSIGSFLSLIYFIRKKTDYYHSVIIVFLFLLTIPMLKHSRHPNFDIPLMMVSFLSISFYIEAFENNLKRHWICSGLFFGLAMLFKGPMAVFIPITMLIHLLVTSHFKKLLNFTPWFGLILGFVVFSIWPLSLLSIGRVQVFIDWFKFTILASALESRGVVKNDYFLYLRHILLFTPIHIALLIFSLKRFYKEKVSNLYLVHLIFFTVTILLTSSAKFKLSHYIMPLYPSLAIVSGLGIKEFTKFKLPEFLVILSLLAGLVVFFIPYNPAKVRDYEIFEIRKIIISKKIKVERFVDVNDAYPYWSLAALIPFVDGINVYQNGEIANRSIQIVPNIIKDKYSKCDFLYELKRYNSSAYYCNFSK